MSVLWRPIDSWGNFTLTLTAVDAVKRHQSDICQEFSRQYWTKRGHGKVRGLSTPKSDSLPKLFRNAILNRLMRLTLMSPRAQVTENNEFIDSCEFVMNRVNNKDDSEQPVKQEFVRKTMLDLGYKYKKVHQIALSANS